MTRPFVFRINAAELFAIVASMPARDHSKFLKSFAHDLITLSPTLDYSTKVIQEAIDFTNKKSLAGAKGGKHKPSTSKALLKHKPSTSQAQAKPEQNTEQNKELEIKLPEWMPLPEWQDFVASRIQLKKPMTPLAQKQIIKKLDGMRSVYSPTKVLSRAISNGWQDLYADDSCKDLKTECVTPSWL